MAARGGPPIQLRLEDHTMPLRDHFRPPLDDIDLVGGTSRPWPAMIVMALNRELPPRYVAGHRVSTSGPSWRSTFPLTTGTNPPPRRRPEAAARRDWAPRPTFDVVTDLPDQYAYEVRVYDTKRHRRLVAAVEIVSPGNKDRPESRRAS